MNRRSQPRGRPARQRSRALAHGLCVRFPEAPVVPRAVCVPPGEPRTFQSGRDGRIIGLPRGRAC
jgi:hypothetical protein